MDLSYQLSNLVDKRSLLIRSCWCKVSVDKVWLINTLFLLYLVDKKCTSIIVWSCVIETTRTGIPNGTVRTRHVKSVYVQLWSEFTTQINGEGGIPELGLTYVFCFYYNLRDKTRGVKRIHIIYPYTCHMYGCRCCERLWRRVEKSNCFFIIINLTETTSLCNYIRTNDWSECHGGAETGTMTTRTGH